MHRRELCALQIRRTHSCQHARTHKPQQHARAGSQQARTARRDAPHTHVLRPPRYAQLPTSLSRFPARSASRIYPGHRTRAPAQLPPGAPERREPGADREDKPWRYMGQNRGARSGAGALAGPHALGASCRPRAQRSGPERAARACAQRSWSHNENPTVVATEERARAREAGRGALCAHGGGAEDGRAGSCAKQRPDLDAGARANRRRAARCDRAHVV
ncbi:hypothetical protein CERSUDRAFT_92639 [Gelatoporia subvermispora B]|uniref:Uncharacterized protein n=1 Tax=Ceriporiopsis subvermispora (strain B) TaxID=914234 RepID=M2RNX2_CERS8|nr:hypothetical protein CERSUDRAFT_92639 [Gelatoporia subvermispora B]